MRKIDKRQTPLSLRNYLRVTLTGDYPPSEKKVLDDIRESLLIEQGQVCGYCQMKIKSASNMKVEHHCEQTICDGKNGTLDLRLEYRNLMAACLGRAGEERHCDTSKSDFSPANGLPIEVSPWKDIHMAQIHYDISGVVRSNNDRHNNEMSTILKLNTRRLKELRRERYVDFMEKSGFDDTPQTKEKLKAILTEYLSGKPDKFINHFPGLSEYLLRTYCS